MGASVLLLHRLPDGSSHYDWMIQREGDPDAGLVTFRVSKRIDVEPCSEFRATRLPDHRAAYLEFEGEVSGNRGWVTRMARGDLEIAHESPSRIELSGFVGELRGRLFGVAESVEWRFTVLADGE